MKPIIPFALLGALFAVGAANAASTTPVGYVTETLKAGQFNLVGLTVHQSTAAAGVLDAETATSVTDNEVNFTSTLTAGSTYILELPSGVIQEVVSWSGSTLTTPQDITAFVTPGTTTYNLRKAPTISDIFGASNSAGLNGSDAFDPEQADLIYVPNGTGGFNRYFYSTLTGATGWFNASDFTDGNNIPVTYVDGMLILRRGATDLALTVTGEVKKVSTTYALGAGQFNYIGGSFPVGSTLASSSLNASLTATDAFDPEQADLVYIPNGTGGYNRFFYSNLTGAEGWFNASDFTDGNATALTSGLIVLRRGAATNATITPPSSYASL